MGVLNTIESKIGSNKKPYYFSMEEKTIIKDIGESNSWRTKEFKMLDYRQRDQEIS